MNKCEVQEVFGLQSQLPTNHLEWAVCHKGYEIAEVTPMIDKPLDLKHRVLAIRPIEWQPSAVLTRSIRPYEMEDLLLDFISIENKPSSFVEFVSKYGLLTNDHIFADRCPPEFTHHQNPRTSTNEGVILSTFCAVPMRTFIDECRLAKAVFLIMHALDSEYENEVIENLEKFAHINEYGHLHLSLDDFGYLSRNLKDEPGKYSEVLIIDLAYKFRRWAISSGLKRNKVSLDVWAYNRTPKSKTTTPLFLIAENLIGVIWHKIALMLNAQKQLKLRRCVICGKFFRAKRSDATTCDAKCRKRKSDQKRKAPSVTTVSLPGQDEAV